MDGRVTLKDLGRLTELRSEENIIIHEIEKLNKEISACDLTDTVEGSDPNFPYVKHTITVCGVDHDLKAELIKAKRKLNRKRVECAKEYNRVIDYIYGIDDSLVRQIFILRFISGLSWNDVADQIGGNNTEYSVKHMCYRQIEKK